jgi:hypothetical protein
MGIEQGPAATAHHYPTEFTNRLCEILEAQGETVVSALAEQMYVSTHTIVTACSRDQRLVHRFCSDQRYWISLREQHDEVE